MDKFETFQNPVSVPMQGLPPRRFRASESSSEKDPKENSKNKEKQKKEDTKKDGRNETKRKPKTVEPDVDAPVKFKKKDDDTDESGGGVDSDEVHPGAMKKPSARQAGQQKWFALLASFFVLSRYHIYCFSATQAVQRKSQLLQRNRSGQRRRRANSCLGHALHA